MGLDGKRTIGGERGPMGLDSFQPLSLREQFDLVDQLVLDLSGKLGLYPVARGLLSPEEGAWIDCGLEEAVLELRRRLEYETDEGLKRLARRQVVGSWFEAGFLTEGEREIRGRGAVVE